MARILVIDDENNIRMMVRLALEQVGHTVDTAEDGPGGLDKFGDGSRVDLVLLDQRMPGMEGLDVLRELRQKDPNSSVIMVTAFGTIDLAIDAMKAGATDFLRKPFTVETLRGAVDSALAKLPAQELVPESVPVLYGLTTINGYHIESTQTISRSDEGGISAAFEVTNPTGGVEACTVYVAPRVIEAMTEHAGRQDMPGGDRFWHALCENALANYVWQNASFPPGDQIRVEEMDRALRKWMDAIVQA
jgi:DNA-binding response OmpR family regulator